MFGKLFGRPITWIIMILGIVALIVLLGGCARRACVPPVDRTIVSSGVAAANQTLDWAKNNLADTADVRLLTGQIASCRDSLQACGDACAASRAADAATISAARAATNMWRIITGILAVILAGVGVRKIIK